jgi:hypothetical protein
MRLACSTSGRRRLRRSFSKTLEAMGKKSPGYDLMTGKILKELHTLCILYVMKWMEERMR